VLCRARAIENQIPHLACNFAEGGGSLIIDAWGEIVAETGIGEAIVLGEIDLDRRDAVRKNIPCFADRRPDLY
jgi:predicted amidohydrolase